MRNTYAKYKIRKNRKNTKFQIVSTGLYECYEVTLKAKYGADPIDTTEVKKVMLFY